MGHLFAHAIAHKAHKDGILDIRHGFHLFRSREVPARLKLGALSIGGMLTAVLLVLEFPLEPIIATLLPFVGFAVDLVVDGAEVIMLPLLIAAAVLPHLQRRAVRAINRID